jgi:hypothetical protein
MIDAYHLPALAPVPTTTWSYGQGAGAVQLRIPQLTPALVARQVAALLAARERYLAERPVREIVHAIDQAARRLAGPADEIGAIAHAALPAVTGYSPAMARRILEHMTADWRAARLDELLRAELGDARLLDGFRQRPGAAGRTRAFGPRLTAHVFSGNVPGVSVTSLVRSLLVKSASLGKTATGEPLLAALFARALASVDPDLGACVAVTYWPGGADEMERAALAKADAVIVYGGDDTVRSVRRHAPAEARFLGYGHRLSFGVVGRERLTRADAPQVARRAALDAATFDQHGCVSPHLFYAEQGGEVTPAEWASLLADALRELERTLPRGAVSPSEAAAIRQLRGEAEFAQIAGDGTALYASREGTAWTVVYEPDPAFAASCLNRVVRVKPIDDVAEVAARVSDIGALLQTVGVALEDARAASLAAALGRLGASRVAAIGEMAWPPPAWHHDGRPPLAELLRWCDLDV